MGLWHLLSSAPSIVRHGGKTCLVERYPDDVAQHMAKNQIEMASGTFRIASHPVY
jgi:hypothetical protein